MVTLTTRGVYRITDRGATFLKGDPSAITVKDLRQLPEFLGFHDRDDSSAGETHPSITSDVSDKNTPAEQLESSYQILRDALAGELLQVLLSGTPGNFEKVVVDLLVAMGYGGSLEDAGRVVGKSGDGGIDGVIKQDRLGLDLV